VSVNCIYVFLILVLIFFVLYFRPFGCFFMSFNFALFHILLMLSFQNIKLDDL